MLILVKMYDETKRLVGMCVNIYIHVYTNRQYINSVCSNNCVIEL